MEIRPYEEADRDSVVDLWRECGLVAPGNDPFEDIDRKLHVQPELLLVGVIDGRVVGSVMAGYDGHRGWINYLAVSPASRRNGYGRLLTDEAEARLRAMGCPKVNLQVRSANAEVIEFYEAIGFAREDRLSMGKRLVTDGQPSIAKAMRP